MTHREKTVSYGALMDWITGDIQHIHARLDATRWWEWRKRAVLEGRLQSMLTMKQVASINRLNTVWEPKTQYGLSPANPE